MQVDILLSSHMRTSSGFHNDMNNASHAARHRIYSRRYFDDSPTWFKWNKLTIADVNKLRQEPGFEGAISLAQTASKSILMFLIGQNIYFFLNHPIQFVRLVGVIVQIDLIGNGKYCLLTIDDGSGSNIELKIERERDPLTLDRVEYLPATDVKDLQVFIELSLPLLKLGRKPLGLGDVVKAQGTLTEYRSHKQLLLKLISHVKDTNEESEHWQKAAEWKQNVLSRPWVLSQAQQKLTDERVKLREFEDQRLEKLKRKSKMKGEKKHRRRQERDEEIRQAEEEKMNEGALLGSATLTLPWD